MDEYDSAARWYYPAIMRTTTPDPLAEKYYSISPYAWCGNNPVRNIDPDGMDWFYNELTGYIQYVSNLYKGAEKGMVEGWKWLGENGMFSKDNDDILRTDLALVGHYGGDQKYPFVFNSQGKPERIISYTLDLKGKDAENFMNDMGYELRPSEALIDKTERTLVSTIIPSGSVSVKDIQKDEVWLSLIYVPKNSNVKSKIEPIKTTDLLNGYCAIYKETYTYSSLNIAPFLKAIGNMLNYIQCNLNSQTPYQPNIYRNFKVYPSNGILNKYKNMKK